MLEVVSEEEVIAWIIAKPLIDCDFLAFQMGALHLPMEAAIAAHWELWGLMLMPPKNPHQSEGKYAIWVERSGCSVKTIKSEVKLSL